MGSNISLDFEGIFGNLAVNAQGHRLLYRVESAEISGREGITVKLDGIELEPRLRKTGDIWERKYLHRLAFHTPALVGVDFDIVTKRAERPDSKPWYSVRRAFLFEDQVYSSGAVFPQLTVGGRWEEILSEYTSPANITLELNPLASLRCGLSEQFLDEGLGYKLSDSYVVRPTGAAVFQPRFDRASMMFILSVVPDRYNIFFGKEDSIDGQDPKKYPVVLIYQKKPMLVNPPDREKRITTLAEEIDEIIRDDENKPPKG